MGSAIYDISILIGSALLLGLTRGFGMCAIICTPGLLPYVVTKKNTWREGLAAGLLFNLPRIVFFAGLGALIGLIGFHVSDKLSVRLSVIGYILIGAIIMAAGASMFRRAQLERLGADASGGSDVWDKSNMLAIKTDDAPENDDVCRGGGCGGDCERSGGGWRRIASRIVSRLSGKGKSDLLLMLVWGSLMGIACISEVSLIEGIIISGAVGGAAGSRGVAVIYGMLAMTAFGIGAAIPVIATTTAAGGISQRVKNADSKEKTARRMNIVKTIGSSFMILLGGYLAVKWTLSLISLLQ
ncbi:MAG: hypothetical protein CVT48_01200 [Thermoplasmata archaeon HGW-Thermoplasmata-1]|nr:MAG: hypothetical protein CVT48_01200 [Thermoplasmata archaeon HGW-Thermoplasmata-1]